MEPSARVSRGRPDKHTRYKTRARNIYSLTWTRNLRALRREARVDGLFPVLCTDKELTAKKVLQAYKYQPRLEKRFSQFKNFHNAASLLFKKVTRVEANLFVFFIFLRSCFKITQVCARQGKNRRESAVYME
jgi:transposase